MQLFKEPTSSIRTDDYDYEALYRCDTTAALRKKIVHYRFAFLGKQA